MHLHPSWFPFIGVAPIFEESGLSIGWRLIDCMTALEVIILFISIGIGVICIFFERHMQRMAVSERKIAYEAEKGKDYATKEDIEDITKQIETVKNEMFSTQRKKVYIVERKRHLLDLLYHFEKIANCQNSLVLNVQQKTIDFIG